MSKISILELALSRPSAFWSSIYRGYELRQEQILMQATNTLGNRAHDDRCLVSPVLAFNHAALAACWLSLTVIPRFGTYC